MPALTPPPWWLHRACSALRDFCFPAVCPFCETREAEGDSDSLFCLTCQQLCREFAGRQCQRCSASVGPFVDTAQGCVHCRDESYAFEAVCSLGPYREPLRPACLRAKQAAGHSVAMGLAQQLGNLHRTQLDTWQPDLVIPVPHHWTEHVWRPHVSPTSLAETLASMSRIPVRFDLLRKIKKTQKQALLPVTTRKTNLRGAFGIGGGATLGGATVLLVDDILTTGTTAHECAKVLKAAGAAKVYVAVFARVAGHS
jgi:predicted amidophosphoribosyltransferase